MLSANTEVSTNSDITRRTKSVPTIEIPPISSGIAAATTPRKTSSRSRARIGKAISSALVRSFLVWSLTSLKLGRVAAHRDVEAAARRPAAATSSATIPPLSSRSPLERSTRRTSELPSAAISSAPARRSCERVDDVADVLDPASPAAEPVDLAPHRRAAQVERAAAGGADDEHDPRVRVVAERVGEQALGLLALRGGVGEAGRLEVVLDVFADRDREDGEGADRREDELRVLPGEVGDAGEHAAGPYQISK